MKFIRMTTWHEESDCGKYRVSAAKHGDKYTWCAFLTDTKPNTLLGCELSAEAARKLCERHANPIPEMEFSQFADMQR